jgi:ADP-ribose pyrophosphatase YjhB (NUDIX family)
VTVKKEHRYERFRFCPVCASRYRGRDFNPIEVAFHCDVCGFVFYQNSVPSATALIPSKAAPEQIILITRATEPKKGLLALPGGILGYHELPEAAAVRETREETGLDIRIERQLCAFLVDYEYEGSRVSVIENAFLAFPLDADLMGIKTQEAMQVAYHDVRSLSAAHQVVRLAFPEQQTVLRAYHEMASSKIPG